MKFNEKAAIEYAKKLIAEEHDEGFPSDVVAGARWQFNQMQAEIEILKKLAMKEARKYRALQEILENQIQQRELAYDENQSLKAQLAKLVVVVKYYANENIYDTWMEDHPSGDEICSMECDRGDRARKALAELSKARGET